MDTLHDMDLNTLLKQYMISDLIWYQLLRRAKKMGSSSELLGLVERPKGPSMLQRLVFFFPQMHNFTNAT